MIMLTAADLEERAIWKLEQAGYAVTAQGSQGYLVTNATGTTIATPTSLDELRSLADEFYDLVWLGYTKVPAA
jgi:hypothetical protein